MDRRTRKLQRRVLPIAVAMCFASGVAHGNPTGPTVMHGQAAFSATGNTLSITNSPGAIINWQNFSIGANEITRFIQQSATSAVLNRVVGANPSAILGALQSNGRVFLINPNGITFGANAQIDVAGFVASTLNLSDADFISGRHRFTDTPGAGGIVNEGEIATGTGGRVYLVAPDLKNAGIIKSPKGEILLAAGKSVELVDSASPEVRVQISAPDNKAVNVGQLLAEGGNIGIYAGLIQQKGVVSANTAVVGENGKIYFRATRDVRLEAGSITTASGPTAGTIKIEAQTGTATVAGAVDASATGGRGGQVEITGAEGVAIEATGRVAANGADGGSVRISSSAGAVQISGAISADAIAGTGGKVHLAATTQTVVATSARVTAGGTKVGGTVAVKAVQQVVQEAGSEIRAGGEAGGTVVVDSSAGSVEVQGYVDASGSVSAGGAVTITSLAAVTIGDTSIIDVVGATGGVIRAEARQGTTLVSGRLLGSGHEGPGGQILLLAPKVGLVRNASLNVSGRTGGGLVLVGGDFQGNNPDVRNAERTYVGPDVRIAADAIESGDGGKVIIWADGDTRYFGQVSARGGAISGNGGFVEVSGKEILNFNGSVNVGAPAGRAGTILLDPRDIIIADTVVSGGNNSQVSDSTILFADGTATTDYTISDEALEALTGNIVLQAQRDIKINAGLSGGGLDLVNQASGERISLQAGRDIVISSPLTTHGAAIFLEADSPHQPGGADGTGIVTVSAPVTSNGGHITLIGGSSSNPTGGFKLDADINAGAGGIDVGISQASGTLDFYIGAGGNTQLTSSDTGSLKTTGALVLGKATTAGADGLGTGAISLTVASITNATSNPIQLSADSGGSFELYATGDITLNKPLTTYQSTVISAGGTLAINNTLATSGNNLTISAATVTGSGSINVGDGTFSCTGTNCGTLNVAVTSSQIFWDGEAGDFNWFNPVNWRLTGTNPNNVTPTLTSDVTIETTPGFGTIQIGTGAAAQAKSLIAGRPLVLSSGSLELVNASNFSDTLTLSGGSLTGAGAVTVSGPNGALAWSGGSMASGGGFLLAAGLNGSLSNSLSLNRLFQNDGALTLTNAAISGTGSINNAGTLTGAATTSNTISVALSNPANATIRAVGALTASNFATNGGLLKIEAGGSFSTGGAALSNLGTSRIEIDAGAYSVSGNTVATDGSGNLSVSGALSAGTIRLAAGPTGRVTLNVGSSITASGVGDAIVISGAGFTNNAGASALSASGGRFLVWSSNADPFGGATPDNRGGLSYNFKQYNATYGVTSAVGSGSGFLYTLAPTIIPTLQGTVTKVYDRTTTATLAAGNFAATGIGAVDGDTVVLSNPTSGTYEAKNVGSTILVTADSTSTITSATNGAATVYGYQVSGAPASGNVGEITQLAITGGVTAADKVYDATNSATISNYSLSGVISGDVVNYTGGTATFSDKNVGTAKTVSAIGLSLGGADAANYTVNTTASTTASITKANLTVSGLAAQDKVYDATTGATLTGTPTLSGILLTDAVTVSGTATSGTFADKNVGSGKAVTADLGGLTLGSTDAGNYQITTVSAPLTASITPVLISLSGSREYDGTTNFASGTFGTINGIGGETLAVTGSGSAASPKVLAGTQSLALGSLALGDGGGGGRASNYTLAGGTHRGTITPSVTTGFVWDIASATDLRWENPANWNQGVVPLSGSSALISGAPGPVVYSAVSGVTSLTSLSSNSGFAVSGGTLNLLGTSTFSGGSLTVSGGTLGGGGTINLVGSSLDILSGGVLSGSRTINSIVNNLAGTVSPGTSPGIMTINGNYVQGSSGVLAIELGGTQAGSQYDQLIVTGSATLGGTLNLSVVGGYTPVPNDRFAVLQAGGSVSGGFAATNYPTTTIQFQTDYQVSSVTVAVGTSSSITEQIVNTQVNQANNSLPTSNIVLTSSTTTGNVSPTTDLSTTFLQTSGGTVIPLSSATAVQDGTYVNVETGQTTLITAGSTPQPGVYLDPTTQTVVVVIRDQISGETKVMTGSAAGVEIASKKDVSLRRPTECR